MPHYSNYFYEELKTQKLLAAHGFDQWPDEEELARYLFDISDKIDALAASLELSVQADMRGHWNVVPAEPAPTPPQPYWKEA